MFGFDDPEYLCSKLEQADAECARLNREASERYDSLVTALGDIWATVKAALPSFDWEGTQSEHYARGMEADLMRQAKQLRDALLRVHDVASSSIRALGLDPEDVGTAARERRHTDELRRRAEALRAQASALDAEAAGKVC